MSLMWMVAYGSTPIYLHGNPQVHFFNETKHVETKYVEIDKSKQIFCTDSNMCIICLDKEKEVIIGDCYHYIMCKECCDKCIQTTNKCPICNINISELIKYKID